MPIDEQTQQLLEGKTEIGIANAPLKQSKRFETLFSRKERLVALFHKDSPYLKMISLISCWMIWRTFRYVFRVAVLSCFFCVLGFTHFPAGYEY